MSFLSSIKNEMKKEEEEKKGKTENWITTWVEFIYVFCTPKEATIFNKVKRGKQVKKPKRRKLWKAAFSFLFLSVFYKYCGIWTTTFTLNLTFRNWKKVVKVNCNLFALSKLLFLRIDIRDEEKEEENVWY